MNPPKGEEGRVPASFPKKKKVKEIVQDGRRKGDLRAAGGKKGKGR